MDAHITVFELHEFHSASVRQGASRPSLQPRVCVDAAMSTGINTAAAGHWSVGREK